jgi:hypothetical protein
MVKEWNYLTNGFCQPQEAQVDNISYMNTINESVRTIMRKDT